MAMVWGATYRMRDGSRPRWWRHSNVRSAVTSSFGAWRWRRGTVGPRLPAPISRSTELSARLRMPETRFLIRWPDGSPESCYSPSLVIEDYLAAGQTYPLADFLALSRTALALASDRVKAKYGAPCRRARARLARSGAAALPVAA